AAPLEKTRSVFRQLSVPAVEKSARPEPLPAFPDAAALVDCMRGIGNDLSAPARAVMPICADVAAALSALPGCFYVSLSGAGPTTYGIFADAAGAQA
ncbi:hypothetical protein MXD81_18315, partial [Microbacteriaceae bacterium K1510]|nr:hypothetical protein [Microbacteriaceae bacterium K1510]